MRLLGNGAVAAAPCDHPILCDEIWPQRQTAQVIVREMPYRQISWNLEAARLNVIMVESLWNSTGFSASLLPRCLSNFRATGRVWSLISRLRDFTRSCGKTSVHLMNRRPAVALGWPPHPPIKDQRCKNVEYHDVTIVKLHTWAQM